jgi:hypothetical protein
MNSQDMAFIDTIALLCQRYGVGHDGRCGCDFCNQRRQAALIDNMRTHFNVIKGGKLTSLIAECKDDSEVLSTCRWRLLAGEDCGCAHITSKTWLAVILGNCTFLACLSWLIWSCK